MTIGGGRGLPDPVYLRFLVLRTALIWLLVRAGLFVLVWFLTGSVATAVRQPSLGLPALLVWVDRRHFREILLPANLGIRESWLGGASLAVALGLDLLAALALSL